MILHYIRAQLYHYHPPNRKPGLDIKYYGDLNTLGVRHQRLGKEKHIHSFAFSLFLSLLWDDPLYMKYKHKFACMNVRKYIFGIDSNDVNLSSQSNSMNNIALSSNNRTLLSVVHIFLNIWQIAFELATSLKSPYNHRTCPGVKSQPPTFETFMSEPAICWPPTLAH